MKILHNKVIIHYCVAGFQLFLRNQLFLSAHIRTQSCRYVHAAVFLEVVLKERDEHSRRCNAGIVEGVGEVVSFLLVPYSYGKTSRLSVA